MVKKDSESGYSVIQQKKFGFDPQKEIHHMAEKNRKTGLPGDIAGTKGVETVENLLRHMDPNMEPGEAIAHITRELKRFIQILGKDKLKELIDILDAGEPKLSPGVEVAMLDTEKVGGGVGTG